METKTYWVGDRPGGTWLFTVLDERTGLPYNLSSFDGVRAVMVDSDNNEYDFADSSIVDTVGGAVNVLWPQESLFTKPGRYVMQLEFTNDLATRRTTVQEILVRKLGGVTR